MNKRSKAYRNRLKALETARHVRSLKAKERKANGHPEATTKTEGAPGMWFKYEPNGPSFRDQVRARIRDIIAEELA